jgi:hypothetical protein
VGSPLEVASERRLEALVVVGDDQLHALEPPPLQRAEQLVVGGLALGVCYLHPEDLPQPVVSERRDHQDALTHDPVVNPHLLIAGVDEDVRVAFGLQRAAPPRFEL